MKLLHYFVSSVKPSVMPVAKNIDILPNSTSNYTILFPINRYRAMFEVMDMPMDWPAEVNYHEAKAFCAWTGSNCRLPTEAEHHVMRGPQVRQANIQ